MARFSKSDRSQNLPRRNPRRKKNGYIVFYMSMLQTYPTCAVKLVAKRAGERWNSMSPQEKEMYKEKARQAGSRTCRTCHKGAPPTHAHSQQDGRATPVRCVLEAPTFAPHPSITEQRPTPLPAVEPYFYVNSGAQDPGLEPETHSRYRYVSTSEHCGCLRAQTPREPGVSHPPDPPKPGSPKERCRCGKRGPEECASCGKKPQSPAPRLGSPEKPQSPAPKPGSARACASCGKKPQSPAPRPGSPEKPQSPAPKPGSARACASCGKKPQSPAQRQVMVRRRCRCGAEYEVPAEELHTKRPCPCAKHHAAGQQLRQQARCSCGRRRCKSIEETSGGSARCPNSAGKRAADRADNTTPTTKKRLFSTRHT